jgi:hypothetical protein
MSKGKWPFRPSHITQAVKAVEKSGLSISGVRISSDGQIIVDTRPPEPKQAPEDQTVVL